MPCREAAPQVVFLKAEPRAARPSICRIPELLQSARKEARPMAGLFSEIQVLSLPPVRRHSS